MKKIWMITTLALAGCGGYPDYMQTTPGQPLPSGVAVCNERDEIGRCREWSSQSDQCVNPEGMGGVNPIVPCASIKASGKDKN